MNNQSAGASNLLSIIIPVFREAGGLCTMLDTVCQAVSEFRDEVELVVVDDGWTMKRGRLLLDTKDLLQSSEVYA